MAGRGCRSRARQPGEGEWELEIGLVTSGRIVLRRPPGISQAMRARLSLPHRRTGAVGAKGVVTGGKSGLRALYGKGSAKHAVNAAVMTGWYSRPQSLAPLGRRRTKRLASVAAPEGAGRASPQSRGRAVDAPQGHWAPRRGRARTGATPRRPLRCGARGTARAWRTVGRAVGNRPWREVSCVDVGAIRCRVPFRGGVCDRRAEWLAGQVS